MANPISNWLYTGAGPGTQAATQVAAKTTPWGQVGKQILAEGAFGFKGKPGGFGSVNVGFDPKYTGKGATNILGYLKGGAQSVLGMGAQGNIAGGTGAGRLAFEKLLQSPLAKGVGTVGRLATGPIGAGITAAMTGAQLGDWAYKNWDPATKFGDWAGGGIYDFMHGPQMRFKQRQLMNRRKQQMQQTIRQAEAAEAAKQKAAADAKAKADAAAAAKYTAPQHHQDVSRRRGDHTASTFRSEKKEGIDTKGSGMHGGKHYADGGLINFYRYGGFI